MKDIGVCGVVAVGLYCNVHCQ